MAKVIQLSKPRKNVLLTGMPGVGKTTMVCRVCEKIEELKYECQGFYTEELREDGQRVGFDVVTFDEKREPLARVVDRDSPASGRGIMVGRYNVMLQSFEQLALPSLKVKPAESTRVVVIDEIGKMELFSKSFILNVKELLKHPQVTVFATIPTQSKGNPFIEEIRHRDDVITYTVTKENRSNLIDDVVTSIKDSLETYGT